MLRTILLSVLAAGAAALSQPAAARPDPAPSRVTVFYGDLDLKQPADARALLGRLRMAAGQVCGPMPMLADMTEMADFNNCRRETVAATVKKIGSPWLTAAYEGRVPPEQLARADVH